MQTTFDKIVQHLNNLCIQYEEVTHDAATTCEQSAQARGESLAIGGKTLLFKSKRGFHLFTTSASLAVDSARVRKILGSQKLRFAKPDELLQLAGVEKGALPPFGHGVLPFELYLDLSVLANEKIAFNAGKLTTSFILKMDDYLKALGANVTYASFSQGS